MMKALDMSPTAPKAAPKNAVGLMPIRSLLMLAKMQIKKVMPVQTDPTHAVKKREKLLILHAS